MKGPQTIYPPTRSQGLEALGIKQRRVFNGTVKIALVDQIVLVLIVELVVEIIHFEPDIRRGKLWLNGADINPLDCV
jgi:hypothetical protein